MALVQPVSNGRVVQDSTGAKENEKTSSMGQDQFLQLLVAQMQYQDPLEPTSNTEWVSQMATFSMVESLNNMQDSMSQQSANALVGKYVLLRVGDGSGDVNYVKGKVDYITVQNGKTMLSVNDKQYSIDTLDTVADADYYEGSESAKTFSEMLSVLPSEGNITTSDEGLVRSAREFYESLTDVQKEYVSTGDLTTLNSLETKINALKATQFINMVDKLPSEDAAAAAEGETKTFYEKSIAKARAYYDDLTDKQKANVTEEALEKLENLEKAISATAQPETTGEEATEEEDVNSLLKKILDEVKASNTNTNKEQE